MKAVCFAILFVFQVFAQPENGDPKKHAAVLLDNAGKSLSAARPEVQVFGLLHLAENYEPIDKKKSLEYFHQAFDAAASIPADSDTNQRGRLQSEIVRSLAAVNVDDAIAMLRQMEPATKNDRRVDAATSIVRVLIQKKRLDDGLGIVESFGTFGDYPYNAAASIFKALPADDPRRNTLFSSAMAAYAADPRGDFPDLLMNVWREIPQSLVQSAVTTLVNGILDRKDDNSHFSASISGVKGTVSFSSRKDYELFNLMHVLRSCDPKRADEILDSRPDLKAALRQFPEGTASMRSAENGDIHSSTRSGSGQASPQQDALKTDREKGSVQADVLAKIANSASDKGLLSQCISMLDDIKDPADRVSAWTIVAEAAHKINDDKLSWQAIDRAMADATALYKLDADEDSPNKALREYWPSTQAYRRIVITAAKLFGVDAEPLLLRITDPDLALLARVEMAQALLERPHDSWSTSVSRSSKK